jgi:uncharacterized radical SAM superfamily Fe-S cluster-containing enzyme
LSSLLNILPPSRVLKRTTSRCPRCLAPISAEILERDGCIVMVKSCEAHGRFEVPIAGDPRFYHLASGSPDNASCCGSACGCDTTSQNVATGTKPATDPFDALSTCLALIEIVDSCNLTCPTCYASSPWGVDDEVDCISFDEYVNRVSGVIARKGFIDILQLTGGEPTIHPRFFDILEWALRNKNIGYVLINTNVVRIAVDEPFRARLGEMRRRLGKFELYVQFDGPQAQGQFELRGADLREIRRRAIDEAGALGVLSTLAMVVTPQTLPHLGDTLRFGLERKHCRGITFQPMFTSGRIPRIESSTLPTAREAVTSISVGDVILSVVEQSRGVVCVDDFTPLPCGDPNCHTVSYLLRMPDQVVGMSKLLDIPTLQGFLKNRVDYRIEDLMKCGCETEPLGELLKQFEIGPDSPFRIFIKPFMDAWTYDQDRIDRCCTHVIKKDGTLDSFCHYYMTGGGKD